jgi:hypothetical protein
MEEIKLAFTLTADQLNAIDGTPVTLASITTVPNVVFVPRRLELRRNAGDAYAIAPLPGRILEFDPDECLVAPVPSGNDLIVQRVDGNGLYRDVLFRVPVGLLLTTAQKGLVVLPEKLNWFESGTTTMVIRSAGIGVSGGSGSVEGWLVLERVPLGL